jgi:hypothetical protein
VLAIVGAALLAWWLFGFTTFGEGPYTARMQRWCGRVTRVDLSWSAGGKITRERFLYTWAAPYQVGDPITSCDAIPPEVWEDADGDGEWDACRRRVAPDQRGECATEYRVDLDRDGRADWRFVTAYSDGEDVRRKIVARRGY